MLHKSISQCKYQSSLQTCMLYIIVILTPPTKIRGFLKYKFLPRQKEKLNCIVKHYQSRPKTKKRHLDSSDYKYEDGTNRVSQPAEAGTY